MRHLIRAARRGDLSRVETLLDQGADVKAKDNEGVTALMTAALEGHSAVVNTLLQRGADVNAKTKEGNTALCEAAWGGHAGIVQALLDEGAYVNAGTGTVVGTALMAAADGGHLEVAKNSFWKEGLM